MTNLDQRIIDLETKISFQDKSIEDLSDSLYQHQQQIIQLEKALQVLQKRIESDQQGESEIRPQEKPPHY